MSDLVRRLEVVHKQHPDSGWCWEDEQSWPCETRQLLDMIYSLQEDLAGAQNEAGMLEARVRAMQLRRDS